MKKITAGLTALALVAASLAPVPALARDRGRHGGWNDHHYSGHYRGHRRDNGSDELAAGALGLVLGLALGAAVSDSNNQPPPPRRYDDYGYNNRGYDPGYAPSTPPANYGPPPGDYYDGGEACIRQVQQWDPYANRYVWVNLRTPC
ncbi:MAG: hypothetical protein WDM79_18770 [Terricaulis sp.]